uniref:Gx transporter family protein n=1 Tax=Butyribacter intestini TaxID=1703332 RepID=UPI003AEF856E
NGVSVAGGVSHNTGQIIVAMLVLKTKLLIYYLPALIISGTVAGIIVGIVGGLLIKRIGFVIRSQT